MPSNNPAERPTILIVEDEQAIRDMVRFSLESEGFNMFEANGCDQAFQMISQKTPDLLLLDWMLPKMNGIEIAKRLKEKEATCDIPIIMLTAKAAEENKIRGFETGADDYIVKPFSPKELVARIKAVLRRGRAAQQESKLKINALEIDVDAHQVTISGNVLKLSPIEYQLLHFFVTHPNRVYTRDQLLNYVWGENVYFDDRTVDVQIRRLRKALAQYHYADYIQTVRGVGYKFSK